VLLLQDAYPPAHSLERGGSVGADTLPLPFPRDPCLFIPMNRFPPSSDLFHSEPSSFQSGTAFHQIGRVPS